MKRSRTAGAALPSLAGLAALLASACAPLASSPTPAFDPQACAEEALRRNPDPGVVRDAVTGFTRDCAGVAVPSACSMLGVLHELGLGVPVDPTLARSLYRLACGAGNTRACGNLGELLLADPVPAVVPDALSLLRSSCAASNGRHCAALGRVYDEGTFVPRSPVVAASWFERACTNGSVSACIGYADLAERGDVDPPRGRTTQLLAMACARGSEESCNRLSTRRPRAPGETDPARLLVGSRER